MNSKKTNDIIITSSLSYVRRTKLLCLQAPGLPQQAVMIGFPSAQSQHIEDIFRSSIALSFSQTIGLQKNENARHIGDFNFHAQ